MFNAGDELFSGMFFFYNCKLLKLKDYFIKVKFSLDLALTVQGVVYEMTRRDVMISN